MKSVMILGGYGTFGGRIAELLAAEGIATIIAGRNVEKAEAMREKLASPLISTAIFDAHSDLATALSKHKPTVIINTVGPFQNADYSIARTCIKHGVHYIDLSDARDFVTGIGVLDDEAKAANVAVISGASTVPALSSAVLDHFAKDFDEMTSLKFGITPGQKIDRGLATTTAILSYVGKPLAPVAGHEKRYGWQDNYRQDYPKIGGRWMANCDVPDLDLLPEKYGLKNIQFSAGMENPIVHFGIWSLGWLRRLGLPLPLEKFAAPLLKASKLFNFWGTDDGAMHMIIHGRKNGQAVENAWFGYGWNGDGPYIPTAPAVVLARKIISGEIASGAQAAVSMVTLEEYAHVLRNKQIDLLPK